VSRAWTGPLLLAGAVCLLVVAELALRRHAYSRVYGDGETGGELIFTQHEGRNDFLLFSPDPDLLWRYKPRIRMKLVMGAHEGRVRYEIRTTRDGFRKIPHTPDAGGCRAVRVVTLGDSRTMGAGVDGAETYAARLEPKLEAALGRPVRVLNRGVDGYTTFHGRQLGEIVLPDLDPDVVTVAYDVNDASRDFTRDHATRHARLDRRVVRAQALLNRSMLYYRLKGLVLEAKPRPEGPGPGAVAPLNVAPEAYEANLREIVRQGSAGGRRVVFLRIPLGGHLGLSEPEGDAFPRRVWRYAERMRAVARAEGVPWVDADDALAAVGFARGYREDVHPAPPGHAAIADVPCN